MPGVEWIEIILKYKRLLLVLFYRPPNSDQIYHSAVEDSIHMAVDTGIRDIVIAGDFNYNMLNDTRKRKYHVAVNSCRLYNALMNQHILLKHHPL